MQHSGFFRRLAAYVIDCILIIIIAYLGDFVYCPPIHFLLRGNDLFILLIYNITLFLEVSYFIFFHGIYGRTPGKKLMRLKVVNYSDGAPITLKQAVRRHSVHLGIVTLFILAKGMIALGWYNPSSYDKFSFIFLWGWRVLVTLSIVWGTAEALTFLFSKQRRALHDFLGNTIVIKSPSDAVVYGNK